jgi:hypothetical protein
MTVRPADELVDGYDVWRDQFRSKKEIIFFVFHHSNMYVDTQAPDNHLIWHVDMGTRRQDGFVEWCRTQWHNDCFIQC